MVNSYDKNKSDGKISQELEYYLDVNFHFYWNFDTIGIHAIKIIFEKRLTKCNGLFYN